MGAWKIRRIEAIHSLPRTIASTFVSHFYTEWPPSLSRLLSLLRAWVSFFLHLVHRVLVAHRRFTNLVTLRWITRATRWEPLMPTPLRSVRKLGAVYHTIAPRTCGPSQELRLVSPFT